MLRATLIAILVGLCSAISFVTGRNHALPRPALAAVEKQEVSDEHAAGLDRRIAQLHLHNVPLDKALSALADAGHLNVVASWERLRIGASIDQGALVSVDLTDVTVGDALRAILPERTWNVRGGVISVAGEGDTEIRVYDIRDLAEDYVRYYYRPNSPAHHAPAPPDSTLRYAAALKDYAQLVTARLGGWADMSELAGRLIINATPEEHARVAAALEQLRVAHAKDPTALLP